MRDRYLSMIEYDHCDVLYRSSDLTFCLSFLDGDNELPVFGAEVSRVSEVKRLFYHGVLLFRETFEVLSKIKFKRIKRDYSRKLELWLKKLRKSFPPKETSEVFPSRKETSESFSPQNSSPKKLSKA